MRKNNIVAALYIGVSLFLTLELFAGSVAAQGVKTQPAGNKEKVDLLISGGTIVTMDENRLIVEEGAVAVKGDVRGFRSLQAKRDGAVAVDFWRNQAIRIGSLSETDKGERQGQRTGTTWEFHDHPVIAYHLLAAELLGVDAQKPSRCRVSPNEVDTERPRAQNIGCGEGIRLVGAPGTPAE